MTPEIPPQDPQLPAVIVKAEQRYLLGFPLLVSVTFDNPPQGARFFDLPELDLFFSQGPIGVQLQPLRGGTVVGFAPSDRRGSAGRMTLEPGEQRQMLLDLSNFGLDLQPDSYRLTLTLKVGQYSTISQPVQLEFVKPSLTDEAEGVRLRKMGDSPTDTGAWAPFLKDNWNTVTVSPGLSTEARQQLGLHLFLHRALYGPDPVAKLDMISLQQITSRVLEAEGAVLQAEIYGTSQRVLAAGAPAGMRFRLEQIANGNGFLTKYRKLVGAEREFLRPPASYPYR